MGLNPINIALIDKVETPKLGVSTHDQTIPPDAASCTDYEIPEYLNLLIT